MIYAQIKDKILKNTIVLDNVNIVHLFSNGFDYCIDITEINPRPSIGWIYDNDTFSPPVPNVSNIYKLSGTDKIDANKDYTILGLYKKVVNITGQPDTIGYYKESDGTTYSDLYINEKYEYAYDDAGRMKTRTTTIDFYLMDDTIGYTKIVDEFITKNEALQLSQLRRETLVKDAENYVIDCQDISLVNRYDLLSSLGSELLAYEDGLKSVLIDAVNNSTKDYLTDKIKSDIVAILTF